MRGSLVRDTRAVIGKEVKCIPLKGDIEEERWPITDGKVNGACVKVLRDTGCSGVIVRASLVLSQAFTGNFQLIKAVDGRVQTTATVRVFVDSPYFVGEV